MSEPGTRRTTSFAQSNRGRGRLLIVSSSDRRVLRQELDGSLVVHADLASLGEHPWNDIVVDGRGNASVNNIGFDFPEVSSGRASSPW